MSIYVGIYCSKCGKGLSPANKPAKAPSSSWPNENHLNMYYEPCSCVTLTQSRLRSLSEDLNRYFDESK